MAENVAPENRVPVPVAPNREEVDEYDLPEVTVQLNPSHPLYLHPDDHPGM